MRRFLWIASALLLGLAIGSPASAGVGPDEMDADTVSDHLDNCFLVPNGPAQAPNDQCDADRDGYGNICDADLDNSGAVGPADFGIFQTLWGSAPGPSGLSCAGTIPCP